MLEPAARSTKSRFYMSACADFESTSEKVFSRAQKRTRSIIEFAKLYDIVFIRFSSK